MSSPKIKKILIYSSIFLGVAVLSAGYLIYDQLSDLDTLKLMLTEQLEELTHRKVSIGNAELSFVGGASVKLNDVAIRNPSAGKPEFTAKSLRMIVKLLPLLNSRVEIQKVIVHDSVAQAVRDAEGRFNFDDLRGLMPSSERDPGAWLGIFRESLLHKLEVRNGEVRFLDFYRRPGNEPLDVRVNKIDLFIQKNPLRAPFNFTLRGEIPNPERNTTFDISGNLTGVLKFQNISDLTLNGNVKIRDLYLPRFQSYLPQRAAAATDAWLAFESGFSGNMGGRLVSAGKATFTPHQDANQAVFLDASKPSRGSVNYKIVLDKDKFELEQFDFRSEQFVFAARGSLSRLATPTPEISFAIQSGEFLVDKSEQYPPLLVFPEEVHGLIRKIFKNGTIQIDSLKFNGALEQFARLDDPKNLSLLQADLSLKKVDWVPPLPPFQKTTGSLKFESGEMSMEVNKSFYHGLPVAKLSGKIGDLAGHPFLDWVVESGVELADLHKALPKILEDNSFEDLLERYKGIRGPGTIRIDIKGPLEGEDNIAIDGALTMDKAEIKQKILTPYPIANLKGRVNFSHPVPAAPQKPPAARPWLIGFEKFSGDFAKSSFSNLKTDISVVGGKPILKTSGNLKLKPENSSGELIAHFLPESEPYFRDAQFSGGEIRVNFHSQGNPLVSQSYKQWGTVDIQGLALKFKSAPQSVSNVSGAMSFADGSMKLKNLQGYYGKSPIKMEGEIQSLPSGPQLSIRAVSGGFYADDLKGAPFLETLEFTGPAKIELALNGAPQALRFESKIDLTRVSYRYKDVLAKAAEAPSRFHAKGRIMGDGKSLLFERLAFELGGNKIAGKGSLKSFEDPVFAVSLGAQDIKVSALTPFLSAAEAEPKGMVQLSVRGKGNFKHFDDSVFEGDAEARDLAIRLDGFPKPLNLKGKVKFVNDQYEFIDGELASGESYFQVTGSYRSGPQPALNLNLRGKSLVLEDFLSRGGDFAAEMKSAAENSKLLSRGVSRVDFNLDQLNYKFWRLKRVAGELAFKDKKLSIDRLNIFPAQDNPIQGQAKIALIDSKTLQFESSIVAKNVRAESLFDLFGHTFKNGLSGKMKTLEINLKGRGNAWDDVKKSLSGRFAFDLDSGQIDTDKLKLGVFDLFGFANRPGDAPADGSGGGSPYERIAGDFLVRQGIAQTEKFLYVTEQRSASVVGKFDLNRSVMDTVMGVAPLPALDKILTKIPVVGRIITAGDEESLVKTYYAVAGPFDNPRITAVPLTSLEKKVVGIFQGILQTPQEIFASPRVEPAK